MAVKLWIDADACPRIIKEIVFRPSERLQVPVCLVANKSMSKAHSRLVTSVLVGAEPDAADDYITENAVPEDLVIIADIPLAVRIVNTGGVAIAPRGELYTEDNIGERLSLRDLMQELRGVGLLQGGGRPSSASPTGSGLPPPWTGC